MPPPRIYHARMISARCIAARFRTMHRLFIAIFLLMSIAAPGFAARWNSKAAAEAFEKAREMRAKIAQAADPSLEQYLACAKTYRSVQVNDPHYGRTPNAIYEEGIVYQEAADRFSKPEYYRRAAARFLFLVDDYAGSPNCPDALKRLGAIYSRYLNDEAAAENAFKRLDSQYGYSEKVIQKMRTALPPAKPPDSASQENATQMAKASAEEVVEGRTASATNVQNIRFWSTTEYTRVIVDMDSDAKYQRKRLSNPDRVYFDIANAKLNPALGGRSFAVRNDDRLSEVRVAQNKPGVVRVVLDLSGSSEFSVSELHDPFRLVIDLRSKAAAVRTPSSAAGAAAVAKAPAGLSQNARPIPAAVTELPAPEASPIKKREEPVQSKAKETAPPISPPATPDKLLAITEVPPPLSKEVKPAKPPTLPQANRAIPRKEAAPPASTGKTPESPKTEALSIPRQASPTSRGDRTLTRTLGLKVGRIVIDPGHGGHDTGSVGPDGLMEKDLVLALARNLKEMLEEKLGAEVFLTRDSDRFIPLEERTAIANTHKADLFISIHANSSRTRSTSGIETYYLDFAKTDAEREIAARENAMTDNNVRDLEDLVKKIAQADKSIESREFAAIVQKRLYSGMRKTLPKAKNRGVRSAPFIVLIGANMPSILAEVAFISNPKDERLLKKESTRESLVKALFEGIDGYMKTLGSDVVQNQAIFGK
jgi:N-acetylmuramoyl-L-alanine amidase